MIVVLITVKIIRKQQKCIKAQIRKHARTYDYAGPRVDRRCKCELILFEKGKKETNGRSTVSETSQRKFESSLVFPTVTRWQPSRNIVTASRSLFVYRVRRTTAVFVDRPPFVPFKSYEIKLTIHMQIHYEVGIRYVYWRARGRFLLVSSWAAVVRVIPCVINIFHETRPLVK